MTVRTAHSGLVAHDDPTTLAGRHRAVVAARRAERARLARAGLAVASFLGHTASLLALLVIAGALVGIIDTTSDADGPPATVGSSTSATP